MKKICIFDFDGTLVDTFTDAGIYYNKALVKYGFSQHKVEDYKYLLGGTLEEVVTRILKEEDRTESNINNIKNYYMSTYPNSEKLNTKPYDYIVELLESLIKKNIILAINTNKKQDIVEKMCNSLFPNINFEMIVGQNGTYPAKPSPIGIEMILEKTNIRKEDAIYIGDSKYDFETATNAGIDAILVTWGAYKKELEQYSCIKSIVDNPKDILKAL